MTRVSSTATRRSFLRGSTGALALGAFAASRIGGALAQEFPSRNIVITIPTREGGGADRDIHNITAIWPKYLDTNFEYEFYPGAAGQVGYEVYVGKKQPDAYNLLFSNMGPEVIMLVLQDSKAKLGEDFVYFTQTSTEPMSLWVGKDSPFKTIQQLVDEGKKRVVTVSVSRLPHPASIGTLALGEATGAQFQLVPYGGGNPSSMAAITGEVDACALPLANPVRFGEEARILTVFADKNPVPEEADNAPPVNEVFGTDIPPLSSSRAFGIHKAAAEQYPDRLEVLKSSLRETIQDPAYAEQVEKSGIPTAFIDYGDQETAMAFAGSIQELARKYQALLGGQN
ncbi:MAG: tripartite tricarboxylate transporter substrate-binding protein [Geminicoccaceae bacterium]